MSTRYNTGNPIESTDVRDMSDNAKNFDLFSGSELDTFVDRLGETRLTIEGAIEKSGFKPGSGDFVTGFTVMPGMRNISWKNPSPPGDNNYYSWEGAVPPAGKIVPPNSTPASTGGISASGWRPRTDNIMRNQSNLVSIRDFGAGVNPANDTAAIKDAYTQSNEVLWPRGTYTVKEVLRLPPGSRTTFEEGCVVIKDSSSDLLFVNAAAGDTTTTAYNGDGDIHLVGPAHFTIAPGAASQGYELIGFVHASGFLVEGMTVEAGTTRHLMEFNSCKDWKVRNVKVRNQSTIAGNEALSECVHWDGSWDSGRFPYAPGASDNTPCRDFEISGCDFNNIYTAYGAHHTDFFGIKHENARICNNTITTANSDGERLRHIKGGIIYGQKINGVKGRASNIRECVRVSQDLYEIRGAGATGTSAVFWQTSEDCVWGPSSTISQGANGSYTTPFEVGSSGLPSKNITVFEGNTDKGTDTAVPRIFDTGINTSFIGSVESNNKASASTWGNHCVSFHIPDVPFGGYVLLAKVGDNLQAIAGTFYAKQRSTIGSGSQHNEVTVTSVSGTDLVRRTLWSQRYIIGTNEIKVQEVTYLGERWIAIRTPTTSNRAFGHGAEFTGFCTFGLNQMKVVPSTDITLPTDLLDGVQIFESDLRVNGDKIIFGNLPTTAPAAGSKQLWNDLGTIKIA